MKITIFLLLIIVQLILYTTLYADTIPEGDVSGTWYVANSPYYITGDITIPADSTLTIEPGVEVEFQGNYSLVVNGGYLEAIGTETDSIHFFPADTNARWDGIGFSSAPDSSHMDYCTVQYATYDGLRSGGGIDCSNSNPVISHCAISHCDGLQGGGIYFNNFNGSISYCTITGNQSLLWGGGIYLNNSSLLLSHCTISDNSAFEAGGIYGNNSNQIFLDCIISGNTSTEKAGGIYINSGPQSLTGCEISDNYADMGGGIYFVSASATLTSCAFLNNEAGSYDASGAVYCANGTYSFSYCTFSGGFGEAAGGIYISANATVDHCTFNDLSSVIASDILVEAGSASVSNCIHSKLNPMGNYAFYGVDDVTYSDFYGNCSSISGGPAGFGELTTVNANGDSCDVYGNIFGLDPLFVDLSGYDYHLQEGSPCIDAGDPAFAYDPDSTITDMGAYYFDQRTPEIELPVSVLDFDTVTVNGSSNISIAIHNIGDGNLLLYDITNSLSVFTNNWNSADSVILPGDSLTFTISFTPTDTIAYWDSLCIYNNSSFCAVELLGRGVISTGIVENNSSDLPKEFALRQAYPNPFNPITKISYSIVKSDIVILKIYNILGQEIQTLINKFQKAGNYIINFDAKNLSTGIYFYKLQVGNHVIKTKKMLLMR
jgi:hypothetical protein